MHSNDALRASHDTYSPLVLDSMKDRDGACVKSDIHSPFNDAAACIRQNARLNYSIHRSVLVSKMRNSFCIEKCMAMIY